MTPTEDYQELARAIGWKALSFKREDLHPLGSHKGRSIPTMIDRYYTAGKRVFAISSSGNAARAAAMHIRTFGDASLDIFVGMHVAPHKLEKLQELANDSIRIFKKDRPLQALTQAIDDGACSLRQSTDDTALIGYASLASELASIEGIGAIFIPTSSGTTAQALAAYFIEHKLPIQVHIVQTSSCHPIADAFELYEGPHEESLADAIVDITALRKPTLLPLIEQTGGRGWVASNDDIDAAMALIETHTDTTISPNSALAVVGAMKASYVGHGISGRIVCLITGE